MAVFHEFCGPALCRPFFVFRVDPCLAGRPSWVLHVWPVARHGCSMSGRSPVVGAPCPAGESVCLYIYLHYRTCEFSLFSVSKNALSNFKNGQKEIIFKKTRIFFSKCLVVSNKVRTFASTKINNRLQ